MLKRITENDLIKREFKIIIPFMTVYLFNRIFKNNVEIPFIGYLCKCHLNDFIGGVVFLSYVNILLFYKNFKPIRSLWKTILFMLFVAISWEYIIPYFIKRGTADFYDVIAYEFGGIVYWLIIKILIQENDIAKAK